MLPSPLPGFNSSLIEPTMLNLVNLLSCRSESESLCLVYRVSGYCVLIYVLIYLFIELEIFKICLYSFESCFLVDSSGSGEPIKEDELFSGRGDRAFNICVCTK